MVTFADDATLAYGACRGSWALGDALDVALANEPYACVGVEQQALGRLVEVLGSERIDVASDGGDLYVSTGEFVVRLVRSPSPVVAGN